MNELEGVELDEAVARVLGVAPGVAYSTDWAHGGPLIERFAIHLNGPESRVHRNGGPNAGWGASGHWTCTSWKLRKADGGRTIGYHETSPLVAAMRLVAACALPTELAPCPYCGAPGLSHRAGCPVPANVKLQPTAKSVAF